MRIKKVRKEAVVQSGGNGSMGLNISCQTQDPGKKREMSLFDL